MTQFHMSYYDVMDLSYTLYIMLLNTTPLPDLNTDEETNDSSNNSDIKSRPVTGTTTMMDYFKR